jgi:hypothetical protein
VVDVAGEFGAATSPAVCSRCVHGKDGQSLLGQPLAMVVTGVTPEDLTFTVIIGSFRWWRWPA